MTALVFITGAVMRCPIRSISLAVIVAAGAADATPIDPVALMSTFNLITTGNASTNGDIEGSMFVGGMFTPAGTATLFSNPARLPADKTSYIFSTNSSPININNGGSLYIGGSNSGNINLNGGGNKLQIRFANAGGINGSSGAVIAIGAANAGTINTNGGTYLPSNTTTIVPPMTVADVSGALSSYSAMLAALPSNGTISTAPNNLSFTYAGTGQAVFAITGAQLASALVNANIQFALAHPTIPVVVNVDLNGANFTAPSSAHFSGVALQNVLFNFYDGTATTLTFNTMWETSILAMSSRVTNSTPIEGAVASAFFVGRGELHNFPYKVFSPEDEEPPPPPMDTPEPASVWILLAALFGLGWWNRKRVIRGSADAA